MLPIKGGTAGAAAAANTQVVNTGLAGGLSSQKDSKESARSAQFGDVLKQMQARYGEQAQKPREIKKTLGKDDFLKIMITQMKNQDPTNPFKAEQMAQEIAQFTSVEQLTNVNQNLNKMANQNRPLEQMAMTGLIGKMVTIDRERFPHIEGQPDTLNFNLPKNANSVKVALVSEAGEVVFEKELGAQKTGPVSFTWDGLRTDSQLAAKSGNYMYKLDAKDDRGTPIQVNPKVRSKVIGVSFDGTEPVFLVGDAKHQDKVTLKNIVQIEMDTSGEAVASQKPLQATSQLSQSIPQQALAQMPAKTSTTPADAHDGPGDRTSTGESSVSGAAEAQSAPELPQNNFFSFKKGIGSDNSPGIDPKLIENYMKSRAQAEMPAAEGFPNGLSDEGKP